MNNKYKEFPETIKQISTEFETKCRIYSNQIIKNIQNKFKIDINKIFKKDI
jgi:hypothetical protein